MSRRVTASVEQALELGTLDCRLLSKPNLEVMYM